MKKLLLSLAIAVMLCANTTTAQVKYVEKMYPRSSVTVTKNVMYQANYSVLTGTPKLDTLRMDVYTPSANTDTKRPLVIFLHTGSYLPRYLNQTPTGARDDSSTVEFCMQMAERGYVVAAISYRLGWNPAATTEDLRKASIINAAYKSVQDVNAAIRYFRKSVKDGNSYGIDSTKVAVGGQGTGSYAMYAHNAVTKQADIYIPKFFDIVKGESMVDDTLWGDRLGYKIPGSPFSYTVENHKGHTSEAQIGFAIGGAMGDTAWMESGEAPLISVHGIYDPFAPYTTGMVYVPGTPYKVVEVSGGHDVLGAENRLDNNDCYKSVEVANGWSDPYTTRANTLNGGIKGLFPIDGQANGSGPWEWWADSSYLRTYLTASGKFTQSQITAIIQNGLAPNPLMSKTRALKYIDTALGYIMPRVAVCLGLWDGVGTKQLNPANFVNLAPNPSNGTVRISNPQEWNALKNVQIMDINGRILSTHPVSNNRIELQLKLAAGIYFVQMEFEHGTGTKQLVVN